MQYVRCRGREASQGHNKWSSCSGNPSSGKFSGLFIQLTVHVLYLYFNLAKKYYWYESNKRIMLPVAG